MNKMLSSGCIAQFSKAEKKLSMFPRYSILKKKKKKVFSAFSIELLAFVLLWCLCLPKIQMAVVTVGEVAVCKDSSLKVLCCFCLMEIGLYFIVFSMLLVF